MKAPALRKRRNPDTPNPSAGELPLGQVLLGNCVDLLATFPEKSVDLVFADPPYFLQLSQELYRPNQSRVRGVEDAWDRFRDFDEYDAFTRDWLSACRRVLKQNGSLWVIGTYHNIFRVGRILQDLEFWILNDVIWVKTNPMPNFRGVRFANAHETLIWAARSKKARYTFNYQAMKELNQGLQMRSDWRLPICSGSERLRSNGVRAHATQKPEALLRRILLASTRPGDIVLDPFFGTGTTGVVAKRLGRAWLGIEREPAYVKLARRRIASASEEPHPPETPSQQRRTARRIPFEQVVAAGMVRPGQQLYFEGDRRRAARVRADGRLTCRGETGSIHQLARLLQGTPCNGWDHWFYADRGGVLHPIDVLRQQLRKD
jgi:modification methylase